MDIKALMGLESRVGVLGWLIKTKNAIIKMWMCRLMEKKMGDLEEKSNGAKASEEVMELIDGASGTVQEVSK